MTDWHPIFGRLTPLAEFMEELQITDADLDALPLEHADYPTPSREEVAP